ncbi:hypothetical protein BpHYR1_015177 [Brachionus plicatilis]|uniref:Uncharacterized protein n=1 Tax=Brachionus plicatilis TaxID=10195 RepID=A0A3M7QYF1_BRAPC|nr:hypothetical protein BpHYR1_015177 [Brachionus plicatilis]
MISIMLAKRHSKTLCLNSLREFIMIFFLLFPSSTHLELHSKNSVKFKLIEEYFERITYIPNEKLKKKSNIFLELLTNGNFEI